MSVAKCIVFMVMRQSDVDFIFGSKQLFTF